MEGLSEIPNGPFLNVKNRGLIWIGVPEQCDRCKEVYPMSWIEFDGKNHYCTACAWDVNVDKKPVEITVSEKLKFVEVCGRCFRYFHINQLTIDHNDLVCKPCAQEAYRKRMVANRKSSIEERERKLTEEKERLKLLSPEQREEAEKEATRLYYERMCC